MSLQFSERSIEMLTLDFVKANTYVKILGKAMKITEI